MIRYYHKQIKYRTLQIGKLSHYAVAHCKLLWLDINLVWPKPIAQAVALEKFRYYRSIFSTVNDLQYMVISYASNNRVNYVSFNHDNG